MKKDTNVRSSSLKMAEVVMQQLNGKNNLIR